MSDDAEKIANVSLQQRADLIAENERLRAALLNVWYAPCFSRSYFNGKIVDAVEAALAGHFTKGKQ